VIQTSSPSALTSPHKFPTEPRARDRESTHECPANIPQSPQIPTDVLHSSRRRIRDESFPEAQRFEPQTKFFRGDLSRFHRQGECSVHSSLSDTSYQSTNIIRKEYSMARKLSMHQWNVTLDLCHNFSNAWLISVNILSLSRACRQSDRVGRRHLCHENRGVNCWREGLPRT
jgi:hypothetical protein